MHDPLFSKWLPTGTSPSRSDVAEKTEGHLVTTLCSFLRLCVKGTFWPLPSSKLSNWRHYSDLVTRDEWYLFLLSFLWCHSSTGTTFSFWVLLFTLLLFTFMGVGSRTPKTTTGRRCVCLCLCLWCAFCAGFIFLSCRCPVAVPVLSSRSIILKKARGMNER